MAVPDFQDNLRNLATRYKNKPSNFSMQDVIFALQMEKHEQNMEPLQSLGNSMNNSQRMSVEYYEFNML